MLKKKKFFSDFQIEIWDLFSKKNWKSSKSITRIRLFFWLPWTYWASQLQSNSSIYFSSLYIGLLLWLGEKDIDCVRRRERGQVVIEFKVKHFLLKPRFVFSPSNVARCYEVTFPRWWHRAATTKWKSRSSSSDTNVWRHRWRFRLCLWRHILKEASSKYLKVC